jgi:hypothetical protein
LKSIKTSDICNDPLNCADDVESKIDVLNEIKYSYLDEYDRHGPILLLCVTARRNTLFRHTSYIQSDLVTKIVFNISLAIINANSIFRYSLMNSLSPNISIQIMLFVGLNTKVDKKTCVKIFGIL